MSEGAPGTGPLVIAHRGSSALVAEHTLGAYRRAIADGADALECDVRLTADGELVCLHDRTLERTGGGPGVVSSSTLAELRAVDWGAWKHSSPGGERSPGDGQLVTLRELVELALDAGREVGLAVETKHPTRFGGRVEHAVGEVLGEYGLTGPRQPGQAWARMMSFSAVALKRMVGVCPELPRVYLQSAPFVAVQGRTLPGGATTSGLDVAIVRERPDVVRARQDAGLEVWVWTVDEPDDVERCRALDVDGIITNRPESVLDALGRNR